MSLGRTNNVIVLMNRSSLARRSMVPASAVLQRRNLTNVPHEVEEIRKNRRPWPFKKFGFFSQFVDTTRKRFTENTKVINVLGPMKVGKHDLAKRLAEMFDLKYYPEVTTDELFILPNGFDKRELNEQLKPWNQFTDLEAFYKEADAANMPGFARTQIRLYAERYLRYMHAMRQLMNTGQGFVFVGGPFQSSCYTDLLWKKNYFTKEAYQYHKDLVFNSIAMCWRPHVFIHLDAPVSYIREQIKKRNDPREVNSPVLTDDYIETLRTNISEKAQNYKNKSEVLTYDIRGLDLDLIVEQLTLLNLEPDILNDQMFDDWDCTSEELTLYRTLCSNPRVYTKYIGYPLPLKASSRIVYTEDDFEEYKAVVDMHPKVRYAEGYAPTGPMSNEWRT